MSTQAKAKKELSCTTIYLSTMYLEITLLSDVSNF